MKPLIFTKDGTTLTITTAKVTIEDCTGVHSATDEVALILKGEDLNTHKETEIEISLNKDEVMNLGFWLFEFLETTATESEDFDNADDGKIINMH